MKPVPIRPDPVRLFIEPGRTGASMHQFIADLYPICRSITGDGVRQTLARIRERIPLQIHEVPSGTQVFDWSVPREWNIRDAWVKNAAGEKVIDFKKSNLHVLNYSIPIHQKMPLSQLRAHLFTLPEHPGWIPYRTSYYAENWGFCLSHEQLLALEEGEYEVYIDASLKPGYLTYGEAFIPGATSDEFLISCHVCHPSLCNDNLSGIAVATQLAELLARSNLRYSYRFLFIPGTIGSITWLYFNQDVVPRIRHGLVLTCVGDSGPITYKRSRRGDACIDRAVAHLLRDREGSSLIDFSPWGYDERQYCSPGFNLPVGCLMRTQHGCFPEYHTSADNLDFVRPECLEDTLRFCISLINLLERNRVLVNLNPYCEPQLGRRGLYRPTGGAGIGDENLASLWVLNMSDGSESLLDIADRAQLPFQLIHEAALRLEQAGLVRRVEG